MDPLRLVDVRAGDAQGTEGYGSGYLIAPRLVLTARHVTRQRSSGLPWPRIVVYVGLPSAGTPVRRSAEVRWTHPEGRDVALLELDADVDVPGKVLWGRVGGTPPVPFNGLAFPLATRAADGHRKVEQLHGDLPPLAGGHGAHNLYALNQAIAPGRRQDGQQAWAGASGAAIFCDDHLVGVVIHDDGAFRNQRLHACPSHTFVTDDAFTDLLRRHGVAPPDALTVIEAAPAPGLVTAPQAALPSWLSRFPTGPSGRFVGRRTELRSARSLISEAGRVLSVVGPEHTGKSAFIEQLVGDEDFRRALGGNRPWGLLELDVPGCGSRFPVSRALATQLDANLFTIEEYGEDTASTERKIKHMLGTLSGAARGHGLVTVIDCARFGEGTADLEADLDEVLGNSAFRRSVVLIASATRLQANGGQQLRQMPPVQLGPLSPQEAAELLSAELDERHVRVDVGQVIDLAGESLVRRPGILLFGVDQHVSQYVDSGPHDADPVAVAVDLLDACRVTIAQVFEEAGCRVVDDSGSPGALAPLAVWAMTERLPLPRDVLAASGIGPAMLQRLAPHGVIVERQPSAGPPHYELSPATHEALRNMTLAALGVDGAGRLKRTETVAFGPAVHDPELLDRTLHDSASALFNATLAHFADEEGDDKHRALLFAVECALGWLRARADGRLPQLDLWVKDFVNALDVESIIPPGESSEQPAVEPAREVTAVVDSRGQPGDGYEALYRAVSQLNERMREPVTAQAEARFVEACEQAVDALCHRVPGLPPQMLRSIENALYLGGRRYGCGDDMLRIRADAARALSEGARQIAKGRVSRLAWTISWLLNTADLQLDRRQWPEGRSSVDMAHDLLELLPRPNTTGGEATQLSLRMRAGRARARAADNEPERLEAWAEAVRLGCVGLERCAPTTALRHLWTRRLLDAAKHQAFELPTDAERSAMVDHVMDILTASYGPVPAWGPPVSLTVARFLRSVHRRHADPTLRLDGANAAMALLLPYEEVLVQQAETGDTGGLLEFARTVDFKSWALEQNERPHEAAAEARKAESYAMQAVDSVPSARAYRVWLECLRHRDQMEAGGPEGAVTRSRLRRAVGRTRRWLDAQEARTEQYAQLARLCIVADWHLRGRSLLQAATAAAKDEEPGRRLEPLQQVYRERARTLEGHENRYGRTLGTTLLRFDLEREYQRLLAAHQQVRGKAGQNVDYGPAWAILDLAESRWPLDTEIQLARARLHRYLWEYTEVVDNLESVIRNTRSGQERRQAQIEMAEALLRHVRYGSLDPSDREAALERAAAQLEEPLNHRFQSERVIVMRERIRLESGTPVDQERVDAAFEKLISTDYTTRIGRYLHSRRYSPMEQAAHDTESEPTDEQQNLAQLLFDDFTDTDLIDGLGQLYLRQAELRGAESAPDMRQEAAAAARRAYDCFDACRVLLEARFGTEHPVNRFKRGDAIRQAARLAGTANPFAWKPEGKSSWLKLACDLFQSAKGRSVGTFQVLCIERISETQRLLNQLTR